MPDCEFYDHYQTIFVAPDVKDIVLVSNGKIWGLLALASDFVDDRMIQNKILSFVLIVVSY